MLHCNDKLPRGGLPQLMARNGLATPLTFAAQYVRFYDMRKTMTHAALKCFSLLQLTSAQAATVMPKPTFGVTLRQKLRIRVTGTTNSRELQQADTAGTGSG